MPLALIRANSKDHSVVFLSKVRISRSVLKLPSCLYSEGRACRRTICDERATMKVKVISRSEDEFTRERRQDLQKVFRNLDPKLHQQERAHEYTRALNATKLEKVFAKPFLGALSGHSDGVSSMAKNPRRLSCLLSGSMDGDSTLGFVKRHMIGQYPGHRGAIRGLSVAPDGDHFVSCGDDCTVRLWELPAVAIATREDDEAQEPVATFQGKNAFRAVDYHWRNDIFATGGAQVDVWDPNRSEPTHSFSWGSDTVVSVRFNPSEPDVMATTASDRSIVLYDLRLSTPLRKLIMQTRSNSVAWNPREAFNFTVMVLSVLSSRCLFFETHHGARTCSVSCNYDMRNFKIATCIHKGHVSAVMDLDYSPTGREFVTGSYDRTVRIFAYNGGHSKEIYHTKRMQRVFCVKFSGDSTYLMSGSDDTNIRLWKSKAAEQLGILLPREKQKHSYSESVKERYKHLPEIKRIDRYRHVPRPVFKAGKLRQTITDAERKREERKRAHSTPGSIPYTPARKKRIVAEEE